MATTTAEARPQSAIQVRQQLLGMVSGYQLSQCLYVAAKLGIADRVAAAPRPVEELAAETGTHAESLYRMLRALASVGVFSEPSPRTIGLSPAAELLRSDVPMSVRDNVLFITSPSVMEVANELLYSVQTGKPAVERVWGKPAFEAFSERPEVAYAFNNAMTALSAELAPAVLDAYDFSAIGTLMDVAGGHGYFLCQALQRHPQMKGILLDQPSVVEGAKCVLCDMRVDDRCQPVAGNFFEHIPAGADAYYMQHILHDWSDDQALKILANVRQALAGRPGGKLIVTDIVLPEDSRPHPGKFLDLIMLMFPGGRERTEAQWRELMQRGGFAITRIVPTRAPDSVIEAVAAA